MRDYAGVTSEFAKELHMFYKGDDINDEVTQPCWLSMELNKKRLEQLNVGMDIKVHENGASGPYDSQVEHKVSYLERGKVDYLSVITPVSTRKIYSRGNSVVGQKKDYIGKAICVLQNSGENQTESKDEVICPGCGAIQTREALIDGCDYCGKQFKVETKGCKVSSYHIFHDYAAENDKMRSKVRKCIIWCIGIVAAAFAAETMSIILSDESALGYGLGGLFKVAIAAGLLLILYMTGISAYLKKTVKERYENSEGLNKIKLQKCDFDYIRFGENLEYKLKMIHYAEKQQDLEGILTFDGTDIFKNYKNVVDCQMKNCCIEDYNEDNLNRYIKVKVQNILTVLVNNKISETAEEAVLNMHISKEEYPTSSLVSYSCAKCGGSIDLIRGGKCPYCGAQMTVDHYDWVIDGYERVKTFNIIHKSRLIKTLAVVIAAMVVFISRYSLASSFAAFNMSFNDAAYSIYTYNNEFIPSLENYGYAIVSSKNYKIKNGIEKHYKTVDTKTHFLQDYPEKLSKDDGFKIISRDENMVVLERSCRYSDKTLRVTLIKNTTDSVVKIERK